MAEKILIIRMVDVGEVVAIGVPAIRHIRDKFPNAEISLLTFAEGGELAALAEPDIRVEALPYGQWPDEFFAALETFLGLAERVIEQEYDQIINLDTAFMPCFLARFLSDASEPVTGNKLNRSLQMLLDQISAQTLSADYVNEPSQYLQSTFFAMSNWFGGGPQNSAGLDCGYPEVYLRQCCGFSDIDMQMQVETSAAQLSVQQGRAQIAMLIDPQFEHGLDMSDVARELAAQGFDLQWLTEDVPAVQKLKILAACDLVVATPVSEYWLARAVDTPVLMMCSDEVAQSFMPTWAWQKESSETGACEFASDVKQAWTEINEKAG